MTRAEWKVYEISICSLKASISKENVYEIHQSRIYVIFFKLFFIHIPL